MGAWPLSATAACEGRRRSADDVGPGSLSLPAPRSPRPHDRLVTRVRLGAQRRASTRPVLYPPDALNPILRRGASGQGTDEARAARSAGLGALTSTAQAGRAGKYVPSQETQ